MRRTLALALLPLVAACTDEPENIQAKAENVSRELERRAAEIENEAENAVAAQVAPLDDEADALLNRLEANAAAAEGNSQAPAGVEGE